MKRKSWVNPLLFLALLVTVALCWFVPARDVSRPNYEFLPEAQMAQSPAYDSFAPNPNFPDGLTLRTPPAGTIARGQSPLHYQPTLQDALRAGQELQNPFQPNDAARRRARSVVFTNYCQVCHGPLGQGNGPVTQGGFPPPASLLADRAVQMKDGQMFHVLTYGQGNMPSFSRPAVARGPLERHPARPHAAGALRPRSGGDRGLRKSPSCSSENCAACHGEDGTGNTVRKILPLIPDFTSLAWQMSQTEMAIVNQIDYGTQPLMPAFRYKLPQRADPRPGGLHSFVRRPSARRSARGRPDVAPHGGEHLRHVLLRLPRHQRQGQPRDSQLDAGTAGFHRRRPGRNPERTPT